MSVEIYEGQVRVFTANKAGDPFVIKNGKRAGQPYCRISFAFNGDTLYLPDFSNDSAGYDGSVCKVAFSQKVDAFGEPELYNGNVQWQLDAIKLVEGQRAANPASPQGQGTPTPNQPSGGGFDPNLSRRQTAANDATRIIAAIGRSMGVDEMFSAWTVWAEHIDAWLIGQSIVQAVIEKLDAVEEDDDDIPFLSGPSA